MKKILTALAVLFILPAVLAEAEVGSGDILELCTSAEKIKLIVEDVPSDAVEIGLTTARIQNVAESRLRAARIYDSEGSDILHIQPNAIAPTFTSGQKIGDGQSVAAAYELGFNKLVFDFDVQEIGYAETWHEGAILLGDADYIVQAISEAVDSFISEFLRVNESKECRDATEKEPE